MKTVFIYALKDPDTGQIRYVGKANNPETRLRKHLCDVGKSHKTSLIANLSLGNMSPVLATIDESSEEHWQAVEAAYIQFYRECGCDLVNSTDGGESPPSFLGKKRSTKTRAKMSVAQAKEKNPFFGKNHSPEVRAKIRAARIGKKHSPEALSNIKVAAALREGKKRQAAMLSEMWG